MFKRREGMVTSVMAKMTEEEALDPHPSRGETDSET